MPTLRIQGKGAPSDEQSSNTPQHFTIPLLSSTLATNAGSVDDKNGSSSNAKKAELTFPQHHVLLQPPPTAGTGTVAASTTTSAVQQHASPKSPPQLGLEGGKSATAGAATVASPKRTKKVAKPHHKSHRHHGGGLLAALPFHLGPGVGNSTVSRINVSQTNNNVAASSAPASPIIKRTKKVAKPRIKKKTAPKATESLPTQKNCKIKELDLIHPTNHLPPNGSNMEEKPKNTKQSSTSHDYIKERGSNTRDKRPGDQLPSAIPRKRLIENGHMNGNDYNTNGKRPGDHLSSTTERVPHFPPNAGSDTPRQTQSLVANIHLRGESHGDQLYSKEESILTNNTPKNQNPTVSELEDREKETAETESNAIEGQGNQNILTGKNTQQDMVVQLVSDVADAVAQEIKYCGSVFCVKHRTTAVSIGRDDESRKKNESLSGTDLPAEKNSDIRSIQRHGQSSSTSSQVANKEELSVSITDNGTIHPLENGIAPPTESNLSNVSADPKIDAQNSDTLSQKCLAECSDNMDDADTVASAVKRFALEVYCPFLLSAKKSLETDSPNADRIRLSTLLAIREMLVMNSDKLLSFSDMGRVSARVAAMRERAFVSHSFANAIVRNTAKRLQLHQPNGNFLADFMKATHGYDAGSDDFHFALARADVHSAYCHPDGTEVGQEESVLAKVSFNYARESHPLLSNERLSLEVKKKERKREGGRSLTQPVPTACAKLSIEVELASDEPDLHKKEKEILQSLRSVLRGK